LQDVLLQDFFQRRGFIQILDGKHLPEYTSHVTSRVKDSNVFLANDDKTISLCFRILNNGHHVTLSNGVTSH